MQLFYEQIKKDDDGLSRGTGVIESFKQQVTFKITKGRWDTYDFPLVFHCDYVSGLNRFRDIIICLPKFKEVLCSFRGIAGYLSKVAHFSSPCVYLAAPVG